MSSSPSAGSSASSFVPLLVSGGLAGCVSRTLVAPLDRIKILIQTSPALEGRPQYTGILSSFRRIVREEGVSRLWQGNVVHLARIFPYSALQFASFDFFASALAARRTGSDAGSLLSPSSGRSSLTPSDRLIAGICTATVATSFTHPLDVIKLRMNIDPQLRTVRAALHSVLADSGPRGLFKGFVPTVLSISPFTTANFATYDFLKTFLQDRRSGPLESAHFLAIGAISGFTAQSLCYPLDTVRRRMQIQGKSKDSQRANPYDSMGRTVAYIWKNEGVAGYYKGMWANAMKIVPANAVRFFVFEGLVKAFGIQRKGKSQSSGGG